MSLKRGKKKNSKNNSKNSCFPKNDECFPFFLSHSVQSKANCISEYQVLHTFTAGNGNTNTISHIIYMQTRNEQNMISLPFEMNESHIVLQKIKFPTKHSTYLWCIIIMVGTQHPLKWILSETISKHWIPQNGGACMYNNSTHGCEQEQEMQGSRSIFWNGEINGMDPRVWTNHSN